MTENLITAPESIATAAPFRAWPGSQAIATVETNRHRQADYSEPNWLRLYTSPTNTRIWQFFIINILN